MEELPRSRSGVMSVSSWQRLAAGRLDLLTVVGTLFLVERGFAAGFYYSSKEFPFPDTNLIFERKKKKRSFSFPQDSFLL